MQLGLKNNHIGTIVPNEFIKNSVGAPKGYVAAYLYCLMYSSNNENIDLSVLSARLKTPESEIIEAFEYWQKKGFAKIVNGSELMFELGVFIRQEGEDLYTESEFFQQLQNLFGSRQLSPGDYIKIFDYTTVFLLPKKVVLLLAEHCISTKGKRVSVSYMDKVAKSWAEQGINTEQKALEYIEAKSEADSGILKVMEQLGLSRRKPTKDEKVLFLKWTNEWGFTLGAIVTACSFTTAAREPSMKYLDTVLFRLWQSGSTTSRTITESKTLADNMTKNIQEILHTMGETSVKPSAEHIKLYQKWTNAYGYDMKIIKFAAQVSSKRGRMPIKFLDDMLTDWFNNGIEMFEEAKTYVKLQQEMDKHILEMFDAAGITKLVVSEAHRRKYRLWSEDWEMSKNAILLAAEISSLANQPMSYLNTLMTSWHDKGVKTLSDAQQETQKRKTTGFDIKPATQPMETYDHLAVDLFSDEGA